MIERARLTVLMVALAGVAVLAAPAGFIQVRPVVAEGQVSASFDASANFDDGAREVLQSGLLLTFTYDVELRRPSTIWVDPTLGAVTVAASAKFDNLTGVYQVSKHQDGRVVWSERTSDASSVRTWMTLFDRVGIASTAGLEPNGEYYVRVHMTSSPKRTFPLLPWATGGTSGRGDFTFLR